jgi:hypothetical protein
VGAVGAVHQSDVVDVVIVSSQDLQCLLWLAVGCCRVVVALECAPDQVAELTRVCATTTPSSVVNCDSLLD